MQEAMPIENVQQRVFQNHLRPYHRQPGFGRNYFRPFLTLPSPASDWLLSRPGRLLDADSFWRLRNSAVPRENEQRGPFRSSPRTLCVNAHPTGPAREEGSLEIFVPSRVAEGQNFRTPLLPDRFDQSLPLTSSVKKKTPALLPSSQVGSVGAKQRSFLHVRDPNYQARSVNTSRTSSMGPNCRAVDTRDKTPTRRTKPRVQPCSSSACCGRFGFGRRTSSGADRREHHLHFVRPGHAGRCKLGKLCTFT